MNYIIYRPPVLVKCEKCGAKYIYGPPYCNSIPTLTPLSLKGWIESLKQTFKTIREKGDIEKTENKLELGKIVEKEVLFSCVICGGELRIQCKI